MKHFSKSKLAILLHYNLMGLIRLYEGATYDFTDVPEQDTRELFLMVEGMPHTEVGEWYESHWQMFPFAETIFDNLTNFQQSLVIASANYVCALIDDDGQQLGNKE